MKFIQIVLLPFLALSCCFAEEDPKVEKKPVMIVAEDGFPAGSATAEGAACDLARAFMEKDAKLFIKTCIPPFGGGENRKKYEAFLKKVAEGMEIEANKKTPSAGGPKKLDKLFAARHLSLNGPSSAGYAFHGFHDIMFVDVRVELVSGKKHQNRTMVIKTKEGQWFVHPAPRTAGLLSTGLNDEDKSTIDFTEAYTVSPAKPK